MKIALAFTLLLTSNLLHAKSYELKELIELAKVHPEVQIEQFEVQKAHTLFEKIDGETRPKLSILSGLGPNRSSQGNSVSSIESDRIDTVTYLAQIDLKIPLFAFNRQSDLHKAADGNLKVKELDVKKKQLLIIKKMKEYTQPKSQ